MTQIKYFALVLVTSLLPVTTFPATAGDSAPDFTLSNILDGNPVSLAAYQGNVVYLDFWASWCGPCIKSFPFMNSLQEDYGEQGLVVIAVNLDENIKDAEEFLSEYSSSFTVVRNAEGDLAESYNVIAMPSTFIIGRDGKIASVHNGFRTDDEAELRDLIVNLL